MESILNFIKQVYATEDFIPLHEPRFQGNEKDYVLDCIESTFVSSVGKYVDQLEEMIAAYTGAPYVIAVVNGTQALFVALQLAGLQKDEEVITQSLTFVATANAIRYHGANPVFIDVDQDTMGMSPQALQFFLEKNTESREGNLCNKETGRRIAAIVPMHTLGHACRITEIVSIAGKYNIPVVEDAAESLGTTVGEKHTGTFGLLGTLSFNGNKLITTGGGGVLLTADANLARQAKHLTTTARVGHAYEIIHDAVGYNFRMPNLNAALGVAQMEQLPELLEGQRMLAKKYQDFFNRHSDANFLQGLDGENTRSNYWINAIAWNSQKQRNAFLEYSNKNKVMTRPFWTPLHSLPMYADCIRGNLEQTQNLYERVVHISSSVPLS